ncbi:MAG: ribonuclease P [Methanolinea sp.]|jgi:ribonuclease P protein subunit RPR2|nr:ribonuclease P [Methanolinea sp.]
MARRTSHPDTRRIARERIAILFSQARECFPYEPGLSDRYVALARKISMKQRVRLERRFRRQFCHHCQRFLVPGVNMRVRISRGRVVVTCLSCRRQMRFPVRRHT